MSEGKVHLQQYGGDTVTFKGLSSEENEKMQGVANGMWWVKIVEGKAVFMPAYKQLPPPIEDEEVLPFWGPRQSVRFEVFEISSNKHHNDTSIIIQSICAYSYSSENYKGKSEKLESYGFDCLRSRRGNDGQYWEIWYLPGLWAAKGSLQAVISPTKDEKKKIQKALDFLATDIRFGSLDLCVQRMAMSHPD